MANAISAKFTLNSGDVEFYDNELTDVKKTPVQEMEIYFSSSGKPVLKEIGSEWEQYEATIEESYSDTLAKIEQLFDEKALITFYYKYQHDSSANVTVFLIPKKQTKILYFGQQGARIIHTLTFLKSS